MEYFPFRPIKAKSVWMALLNYARRVKITAGVLLLGNPYPFPLLCVVKHVGPASELRLLLRKKCSGSAPDVPAKRKTKNTRSGNTKHTEVQVVPVTANDRFSTPACRLFVCVEGIQAGFGCLVHCHQASKITTRGRIGNMRVRSGRAFFRQAWVSTKTCLQETLLL